MATLHRMACSLIARTENMNTALGTWKTINTLNQFRIHPAAVINSKFCRFYKGSNRYKRGKAMKEKMRLLRELESEYGIPIKQEFNKNEWMKSNYFTEFNAFQTRLNIKFNDHQLLMSAFAHPSFMVELESILQEEVSSENKDLLNRFQIKAEVSSTPYQKLSLLGFDTTLLILKEAIYNKFPNATSSICADILKFLTSRETITMVAKNLAIDDLLLLSRELDDVEDLNKEYHLQFTREDIICDTFYSVVGAVEKDLGHSVAKDFVNDFLTVLMDYEDLSDHVSLDHAHEELMKILSLQGVQGNTRARTIVETGVNSHFPFYFAGIYCNGCKIGEGSGYSAYTARIDAFKNTVFSCLEGNVDFVKLRKEVRRI